MWAGGTSNCSLYLTHGYRDARIMVFKEPMVTSCSKGNFDGIRRERSSDQAVKGSGTGCPEKLWILHPFKTQPDKAWPTWSNCEVNPGLSRWLYYRTSRSSLQLKFILWLSKLLYQTFEVAYVNHKTHFWLLLQVKYPSEMEEPQQILTSFFFPVCSFMTAKLFLHKNNKNITYRSNGMTNKAERKNLHSLNRFD